VLQCQESDLLWDHGSDRPGLQTAWLARGGRFCAAEKKTNPIIYTLPYWPRLSSFLIIKLTNQTNGIWDAKRSLSQRAPHVQVQRNLSTVVSVEIWMEEDDSLALSWGSWWRSCLWQQATARSIRQRSSSIGGV
jgi:hypothetical protein